MVDSKSVTIHSIEPDLEKADAQSTMSVFRFNGSNRYAADNISLRPPTFKQPTHVRVTLPTTLTSHGDKFLLLVSPDIHPQIQSISSERTNGNRNCIFSLNGGDRFKLYLFSAERLTGETMHGYCGSLSFSVDELTSSMGKEWKLQYRGRPQVSVRISTSGPPSVEDESQICHLNQLFLRAHLESLEDLSWWDLDKPSNIWDLQTLSTALDIDPASPTSASHPAIGPVPEPWRAPNYDLLAYRVQCLLGDIGPSEQPSWGWGAWRGWMGGKGKYRALGMDKWGARWAEKLASEGGIDQRILDDVVVDLNKRLPEVLTDSDHRLELYRDGNSGTNIWSSNGKPYFMRPPTTESDYEQYRQVSERLVLFTTVLAAIAAGLVGGTSQMSSRSTAKIYSTELWIPAIVVLTTAALVTARGILSLLALENEVNSEPEWNLPKTWIGQRTRVPMAYNFTRTRTYWRITQSLQERFIVLKLIYLIPAIWLTGFGTLLTISGLFVFAILSWSVDGDLNTPNLDIDTISGRCHMVLGKNICVAFSIPIISAVLLLCSLIFISVRRRHLRRTLSRRFHLERMREGEVLRKEVILLAAHLMQWEDAKDVWQSTKFSDEEQEEVRVWYRDEENKESMEALAKLDERVVQAFGDVPVSGVIGRTRREERKIEEMEKRKERREKEREERERRLEEMRTKEVESRQAAERRREEREVEMLGAMRRIVGELDAKDLSSFALDRGTTTNLMAASTLSATAVPARRDSGRTLRGVSTETFTATTEGDIRDIDSESVGDAESFVTSNGLV